MILQGTKTKKPEEINCSRRKSFPTGKRVKCKNFVYENKHRVTARSPFQHLRVIFLTFNEKSLRLATKVKHS